MIPCSDQKRSVLIRWYGICCEIKKANEEYVGAPIKFTPLQCSI